MEHWLQYVVRSSVRVTTILASLILTGELINLIFVQSYYEISITIIKVLWISHFFILQLYFGAMFYMYIQAHTHLIIDIHVVFSQTF